MAAPIDYELSVIEAGLYCEANNLPELYGYSDRQIAVANRNRMRAHKKFPEEQKLKIVKSAAWWMDNNMKVTQAKIWRDHSIEDLEEIENTEHSKHIVWKDKKSKVKSK